LLQNFPKLLETNLACLCLQAQCAAEQEKWQTVLDILEDSTHGSEDGTILEFLLGKAHLRLNDLDQAKVHLKKAIQLDPRNVEAMELIMSNNLLDAREQAQLVDTLPSNSPQHQFIKLLHQSRLQSYSHDEKVAHALHRLEHDFGLQGNLDLAVVRAQHLFNQYHYQESLDISKEIVRVDADKLAILPIYIACMVELEKKHDLFYKAHELVEKHPNLAVTWYAVACYYHLTQRPSEARRYFGKATSLEPTFAAAWLGFAHAFAKEGEHDQAIAAYSTAAKLFSRVHLPFMYIGMQHAQLGNYAAAEDYLISAMRHCQEDPLLLNELGVVCYHTKRYLCVRLTNWGRFEKAVEYLEKARELCGKESTTKISKSILSNLANSHRRLRNHQVATTLYNRVLELDPRDAGALSGLGVVAHLEGHLDEAAKKYHQALAIKSDDFTTEMLGQCLAEMTKPRELADDDIDEDQWVPPILRERLINIEEAMSQKDETSVKSPALVRTTRSSERLASRSVSGILMSDSEMELI
jgi:anaphase-promoting complex subunit 6